MFGVDGAQLGVCTLQAAAHPTDKCGPTGLPLTPNSVRIFGRMQVRDREIGVMEADDWVLAACVYAKTETERQPWVPVT